MLYLSMEGLAIIPLTLLANWGGHDVFLDITHDLLDLMIESCGQHNREPNGSHT